MAIDDPFVMSKSEISLSQLFETVYRETNRLLLQVASGVCGSVAALLTFFRCVRDILSNLFHVLTIIVYGNGDNGYGQTTRALRSH